MKLPSLTDDARFATHHDRGANMAGLDELITEWSELKTTEEILAELELAGVPAGRIYTAQDILQDVHFKERESVTWFQDKRLGNIPMCNVMPRLSRTPGSIRTSAPDLGEDTENVLREILSYEERHIQALRSEGTI